MVHPHTDPAQVSTEIVHAIGDGLALGGIQEVMNLHLLRVPLGAPRSPAILEPPHQFLLLGVHRDRRLAALQLGRDRLVDVLELRIPIGMTGPLQRLAVGLQAVFQVMQQSRHQRVADLIALRVQFLGQATRALAGPAQRRLRIPSRHRFHQILQRRRQSGHQHGRPLPPGPRASNPGGVQGLLLSQLRKPSNNRIACQPDRTSDHRDPTPPQSPGLSPGPHPPVALVHRGQKRAVLCADLLLGSHAARIGQTELMIKLFRYDP